MNKTRIDWATHSINPIKGLCPVGCSYCYARRMYRRFGWDETLRFEPDSLADCSIIRKTSRIFVGSTMELFGEWVKPHWMHFIFDMVRLMPQHTFIFLTKRPENLIKWSPFPDNCWVGVSVTDAEMFIDAVDSLRNVTATVKFISFEPLLEQINGGECDDEFRLDGLKDAGINWVIIGQQTPVRPATSPKIEWIEEIEAACKKADIPYFEKDNLKSLLNREIVQHLPSD